MLYDKRWEKKAEPTKTEIQEWQVILSLAADEIEKIGWCQWDYYELRRDKNGQATIAGYCALGAIRHVGGVTVNRYEAEVHLGDALPVPIAFWNDCPVRTKEEVVAKLREVASAGN